MEQLIPNGFFRSLQEEEDGEDVDESLNSHHGDQRNPGGKGRGRGRGRSAKNEAVGKQKLELQNNGQDGNNATGRGRCGDGVSQQHEAKELLDRSLNILTNPAGAVLLKEKVLKDLKKRMCLVKKCLTASKKQQDHK
jgi:hypothetical protein